MVLVIDGNSLVNVCVGSYMHTSTDTNLNRPFYRVLDKLVIKDDASVFYNNLMYRYLHGLFNILTPLDAVYIAIDKSSWRREYYNIHKKKFINRVDYDDISRGYKGNRKVDSEKKEQMKELVKYLTGTTLYQMSKNISGLRVVAVDGLEGDDVVYRLVDKLKVNNDVTVWSNDSDLHQLLDTNVCILGANDSATKMRKLFRIDESLSAVKKTNTSVLNLTAMSMSGINVVFDGLVGRNILLESRVNYIRDLFTKILCGEDGDNIPPCYSTMSDKGKVVNVTKVKVSDKVYSYFSQTKGMSDSYILSLVDSRDQWFISSVCEQVCLHMKKEPDEATVGLIRDCLLFNIRLIRLSVNFIPVELLNQVDRFTDGIGSFDSFAFNSYVSKYGRF